MRALGGSGTYVWSSSDPTIARMAEREKLWSVNVGSTIIKASDLHNPENFATIVVEVQPVHHLTWLEDRLDDPSSPCLWQRGCRADSADGELDFHC